MLTNDDVRLIIEALFDIRTELPAIALLEAQDDEEGSDEEDP